MIYRMDAWERKTLDEVQRPILEPYDGVQWFSTTAGAQNPEEEVPVNPLPDQVNEEGADPETDSDRDEEEETERIVDDEEEDAVENGSESGYESESPTPKVDTKRGSRRKAGLSTTKNATPKPQAKPKPMPIKNEALVDAITIKARLPPCQIGAVELLTFFPHHSQWPEVGLRIYRNGWKHPDVARIHLHARGTLTKEAYIKRYDALKHQILRNGRIFFDDDGFKPTTHKHLLTAVTTYDASNYAPRDDIVHLLVDATLVDIAEGVVNWPAGEDRGVVTQAIEHAYINDLRQYTAADIPQLAQQMGFVAPNEASTQQWDQSAKRRVDQIAGLAPKVER
jgi:hypothetical protein